MCLYRAVAKRGQERRKWWTVSCSSPHAGQSGTGERWMRWRCLRRGECPVRSWTRTPSCLRVKPAARLRKDRPGRDGSIAPSRWPRRELFHFDAASLRSLSRWARFDAVTLHGRLLRSPAGSDAAALLSPWAALFASPSANRHVHVSGHPTHDHVRHVLVRARLSPICREICQLSRASEAVQTNGGLPYQRYLSVPALYVRRATSSQTWDTPPTHARGSE